MTNEETLQKKLDIAVNSLKKYQKAINEFKKDPMNNLVMLSHQVIYDIDRDIQQALKEIGLVGTSMSLADNKIQANTLADNKMQAKEEEA